MARARKFYEKVLGLTMTGGKPAANAGGAIAFEVADIDKAAARLAKARAKVLFKLYETPVCWFASYRDTEGNAFMIHEKK